MDESSSLDGDTDCSSLHESTQLELSYSDNECGLAGHPVPVDTSDLIGYPDCSSVHESPQVLRLLSLIGVQTLQKSMFFDFQRLYLWPAVQEVWKSEQDLMIQAAQGEKLCLAGDGRADSPGHSADFGTYTLMDVTRNRVFHIELVKSTEVSSSNRMEKEGLVRAFTSLQKQGVEVGTIVTDRHREVNAYLRINHPDVQHRFDGWHFAKVIKKKIDAVSRTKAHEVLRKWKSTIIRHLYWCARTSDGDGDLVLAKWKSIMRHVIDVHIHQDPLHPACAHGDIRNRKWLEEGKPSRGTCCSYLYLKIPHFCTGTETFRRLESVLMPAHLLRDIPRISPKEQTYALESFHGILVHFAPKSSKFKYDGMLARTQIAAMHYNFNAERAIKLTADGEEQYAQRWSKADKQWRLIVLKEAAAYGYVSKLIDAVLACVARWPTYELATQAQAAQRVVHATLADRLGGLRSSQVLVDFPRAFTITGSRVVRVEPAQPESTVWASAVGVVCFPTVEAQRASVGRSPHIGLPWCTGLLAGVLELVVAASVVLRRRRMTSGLRDIGARRRQWPSRHCGMFLRNPHQTSMTHNNSKLNLVRFKLPPNKLTRKRGLKYGSSWPQYTTNHLQLSPFCNILVFSDALTNTSALPMKLERSDLEA
ncbi:hypothetical protein HPB47_018980 [Ixodes persulcatus]|uniref:Uncharacterized protein n=1 Tax=Ixodes persulcatus TaxID=34615 RepID=A0AC60QLW1_IXOPE|nr:hypothetical protein HPB47_018980 [Ixodes persulcatus]